MCKENLFGHGMEKIVPFPMKVSNTNNEEKI